MYVYRKIEIEPFIPYLLKTNDLNSRIREEIYYFDQFSELQDLIREIEIIRFSVYIIT